jgi:hypothetical protein
MSRVFENRAGNNNERLLLNVCEMAVVTNNSVVKRQAIIIIIFFSFFFSRPWYLIPKGLEIVNDKNISKSVDVSRLVFKSIMFLLRCAGEAYCVKLLKRDRSALEQRARFARVVGDGGNRDLDLR